MAVLPGVAVAASEWFMLLRHELVLFAASFFLLGALDEIAIDLTYLWLRLTGRARTPRLDEAALLSAPLRGPCAVFIPAWREERVIGATVSHALRVWPQRDLRVYVGCYPNDPDTMAAASRAADGDLRLRIVVHDAAGPTSKPDCLNLLYRAMASDELAEGWRARMVLLHDAEDMVDPAALPLLDAALESVDFAQLPVMALPHRGSRWIAGHYTDEFAEAHGRTMVVRSALGVGIPGAGVGCAIARDWLAKLTRRRDDVGPFAAGSLTEDYELGLRLSALGARSRFVRARVTTGRLVATRAYFPSELKAAIRQKARWVHGIAFQGWDRLGWPGGLAARWMMLRDRRGPLAALLLALAYGLILVAGLEYLATAAGLVAPAPRSSELETLLWLNFFALVWRVAARALFTAREFGWAEGVLAVPRTVVSNAIAIIAGRRAVGAYLRTLGGGQTIWEKTEHDAHPALTYRQTEMRKV
jgi:bacteriophage N4 adsorption protein B